MFIRAMANNEIALLAWGYDQKIDGCLGFAIYRINEATNEEVPLPAWVGFEGQANLAHDRRTTEVWPIQKYSWRDLIPRHDVTFRYKVVPMVGTPEHPVAITNPSLIQVSNPVQMSRAHGDVDVVFNRGILSTQSLAHSVPHTGSGGPSAAYVRDRIEQPSDPLRNRLAGSAPATLRSLLDRAAQDSGHCHLALYELHDTELVQALLDLDAKHYNVLLSNSSTAEDGTVDATNASARRALHDAKKRITDRMLRDGHIGHNKFVVYSGTGGSPEAVLTGSTNWTSTGLCAQTNNALVIRSPDIAAAYLEYWQRLIKDDADQDPPLREANGANAPQASLGDGSTVRVWFSPNTKRKTKPSGDDPPAPPDLEEIFGIIRSATQGVLFLAFIPGSPSIMDVVREVSIAKPNLFVRGALTDQGQAASYVDLYHRDGGEADARVVPAVGIADDFAWWEAELNKLGHAVIHDKIVVVDPFSKDCVVVTGSHNLGFKASYQNDENLVIIRGNRGVAEAYAAHVIDVYDHYRWRYVVQEAMRKGTIDKAWPGLWKSDRWQDKYFKADSPTKRDLSFWSSGVE